MRRTRFVQAAPRCPVNGDGQRSESSPMRRMSRTLSIVGISGPRASAPSAAKARTSPKTPGGGWKIRVPAHATAGRGPEEPAGCQRSLAERLLSARGRNRGFFEEAGIVTARTEDRRGRSSTRSRSVKGRPGKTTMPRRTRGCRRSLNPALARPPRFPWIARARPRCGRYAAAGGPRAGCPRGRGPPLARRRRSVRRPWV
jgi:hypothetical protein